MTLTENCQPAITAVSLASLSVLNESGISQAFVQVTAWANMLPWSQRALSLKRMRSDWCIKGCVDASGSLEKPRPHGCGDRLGYGSGSGDCGSGKADGILDIANHNTAQQIVITGQKDPVARAVQLAKEKKGKAIP